MAQNENFSSDPLRNPQAGDHQPREGRDLPSLRSGSADGGGLGSLAQQSRGQNLKWARWIMIFVGVVTIGVNVVGAITLRDQVDAALRKAGAPAINNLPPPQRAEVEKAMNLGYVLSYVFIALGVVFIVLGIMVYQFPVQCTIAGLVLYILANIVGALIDPSTIAAGLIVKIAIIVALVKAIQAAQAYVKEQQDAEFA